ncbi:hypothetical protein N7493_006871 [Penicillium malachiteum]|uniref:BTB domain-containing protein n=1 Tax=Penicillium malachiteum TaxID=1324776 RepID=A0AAD6MUZ2_9EURO|nr:hypothetical protein N7493_006871 [Penicillium malachiteum]
MDPPTHIIDPDGEVVIILRNADSPFAQNVENMNTARDTHVHREMCDSPQSSAEATQAPKCSPKYQEPTSKANRKAKKSNKSKHRASGRNRKEDHVFYDPAIDEATIEESATEYPTPEEAATEDTIVKDPVVEESTTEYPVPEDAVIEEYAGEDAAPGNAAPKGTTVEDPTAEESAAEEYFSKASNSSCFRIQVSAKHMILASPVFKTMFTGDWKESITLAKKGSVEVNAESWNIEALLIVLHAIHCQHYKIPQKLTLEMLAQVAVIADYYQCKEPLHILKDIWIKNMEEAIPKAFSRDLVLWLWIAWFFQLPFEFKVSTSIAMSHSNGWIDSWGLPVSHQVIGKGERYFPSAC